MVTNGPVWLTNLRASSYFLDIKNYASQYKRNLFELLSAWFTFSDGERYITETNIWWSDNWQFLWISQAYFFLLDFNTHFYCANEDR